MLSQEAMDHMRSYFNFKNQGRIWFDCSVYVAGC